MNLLAPAALWFSLLAGPILLLYMLKLRRKPVTISSTMLWQKLLRDRQANAPWQRLQRNLFLLIQLLILAALVLALARPVQSVPGVAANSVIILLDASASMNAADVAPSRFEAARQIAQSLISDLPSDARMTIISAGPDPQTLIAAQNDHNALRQALEGAQPSQGPADWQAAFTLTAGAASSAGHGSVATVIVSDGGLPDSGLPALPGEVRYLPVGQDGDNLAIAALAVRAATNRPELFARVKNYGSLSGQAILSVYADGQILQSRQVDLESNQDQSIILSDLPPAATRFEARLLPISNQPNLFRDSLTLDNKAFAVYRPARQGSVLLVSSGNLFLEQVLSSFDGLQAFRVLPDEAGNLELPQDTFDLYVLDGLLPDPLPQGNLLLINPPASALLPSSTVFTDTAPAEVIQSPLTDFVEWQDVHILQARQILPPDWAQTLIEAPGGPLVLAGEYLGQRIAVVTFDLHDSDLPLQLAFPILMANLIDYLQPGEPYHLGDLPALQPGQRLSLPAVTSSGTLQITTPSGNSAAINAGSDSQFLLQFDQIGFYSLADPAQPDSEAIIAVNLFDPQESDISPITKLMVGQKSIEANEQTESGRREMWPWLAAVALLILWLEWWLYHRRQVLPTDWRGRLGRLLRTSGPNRKPGDAHD